MHTATIDTLHAQLAAIAALADAAEPRPTSQALEAISLLATEALNILSSTEQKHDGNGRDQGVGDVGGRQLAVR